MSVVAGAHTERVRVHGQVKANRKNDKEKKSAAWKRRWWRIPFTLLTFRSLKREPQNRARRGTRERERERERERRDGEDLKD